MLDKVTDKDVTVIGGGLAGMAAAIHLARAGFQVLCIEASPDDRAVVGESLDWSAPDLLGALGLPMERLIAEDIATYKRHIVAKSSCGITHEYIPSEWLGNQPWNIELRTMHVDRTRLKSALREIVLEHGVDLIGDTVSGVEKLGKRVIALRTQGGKRVDSPWFIDASGFAGSVFARVFHLPQYGAGPNKVALWSYFSVPDSIEGTTLYIDGKAPPYLDWVWEIPIHPRTISVGYVCAGEAIKAKRQQGRSVRDIYTQKLEQIPRFEALLQSGAPINPLVTSFRCRGYRGIAGPNWLMVGEAASMVDPMTSNGVTAALRHAEEASSLIVKYFRRGRLPILARAAYSRRVQAVTKFFNSGIERIVYDWPVRRGIGVVRAGDVYTIPAWLMNVVYSRTRPRGCIATELLGLLFASLRAAACVLHWICRKLPQPQRPIAGAVT